MESAMDFDTRQNKLLNSEIQLAEDSENLLQRQAKIKAIGEVIVYGNWIRTGSFKFQALRDIKFIEKALLNFKELEKKLEAMKSKATIEQDQTEILKLISLEKEYKNSVEGLLSSWHALQDISKKRETAGDQLLQIAIGMAQVGLEHVSETAATTSSSLSSASTVMATGQGIVLLLGICLAILIIRSITKPINAIVRGLAVSADRVATASGQVSSSSQELAEGASEQAASIEETSSSLEEMSSMTRQNAGNAKQANLLMTTTRDMVSEASRAMERLIVSMSEISKASEDTSKIVKTIDEIAFQTNLLALNAAVEAARAGEAGAGFAVVADEVRNLAMRAAEAAKNTSGLIEGTVRKVKEGSDLLALTDGEFHKVASSVEKSAGLVGEITVASHEQALGIEQVNTAVCNMDKVVQRNAANAEESASASKEMSAQAVRMKEFVLSLKSLVEGAGGSGSEIIENESAGNRIESLGNRGKSRAQSEDFISEERKLIKDGRKDQVESGKRMAKELIPFDGEDVSEF
jgi:methyl-accepting chemotaxis protein